MKGVFWLLAAAPTLVVANASAKPDAFLQSSVGHGNMQLTTLNEDPTSPEFAVPVEFPEHSHLPAWVQYFWCILWIVMLAGLPAVVPLVNRKMPTKSQIAVGVSMSVVFFGGLYLFTNIILFQSIHFKNIRPLTIVECMYFMSQVITTVGYGDITPAKVRGQVFVGLYVLGAMFIISMVVSDVVNQLIESADNYKKHLRAIRNGEGEEEGSHTKKKKKANTRKGQRPAGVREIDAGSFKEMLCLEPPSHRPPVTALFVSLAVFAVIDVIWISFFSLHPGEGKTVFQALYMSVITLSSVGFGWFTPVTEEGMIFAAFFMLFGCAALVNVITQFTELMMKLNEYEKVCSWVEIGKEAAEKELEKHQGPKGVSETQFLHFCLLQMKCVHHDHLDRIDEAYIKLRSNDGYVDVNKLKEHLLGITEEDEEKMEKQRSP